MSLFIDTKVVVSAFDRADPSTRQVAIELLGGTERLVLSTQVLIETWWVLTRRIPEPLDEDQASEVINRLSELPVVSTDQQLVKQAIETCRRFDIAIWDALIIESARTAGCTHVLSEDFQSGQEFHGVTVKNPFA